MFFKLLTVARMVVWTNRQNGMFRRYTLSPYDLYAYFKIRMTIRCNRIRLSKENFSDRWVEMTSLIRVKGADLE